MEQQNGFTLLELLVSITIVGILTGVAIPQYTSYRKKAFDAAALSDLRSVALAEEAYFIDTDEYLSCSNSECQTLPGIVSLSKGVLLTVAAEPDSFIAQASHSHGTGRVFIWDSIAGGLQD